MRVWFDERFPGLFHRFVALKGNEAAYAAITIRRHNHRTRNRREPPERGQFREFRVKIFTR